MRRCLLLSVIVLALVIRAPDAAAADACFPETGQCIDAAFQTYWEQNGALPVFGFPIAASANEPNRDTGQSHLTQWFERNRLELHPDQPAPYTILLGRLGDDRLRQLGRDWSTFPKGDPTAPHYVEATGHAIAPQFWDYWRSHGLDLGDPGTSEREALALFGYPLSEPAMETNAAGDTVLAQWFERARFEYHPANPDPYKVLLGLLGNEVRAGANGSGSVLSGRSSPVPVLRGDIAVWYENWDGNMATSGDIVIQNVRTQERFTLPRTGTPRLSATTDGTMVVWVERPAAASPQIVGYDIGSRTQRVLKTLSADASTAEVTIDAGVLYYVDSSAQHSGIFAYDIATAQERRVYEQPGLRLFARDGILLWNTFGQSPTCTGTCPILNTLQFLRVATGEHRTLGTSDFLLSTYDTAGGRIVWGRYGEGITLYDIDAASGILIPTSRAGNSWNPRIQDDHIVWGSAPRVDVPNRWSLVDYQISTRALTVVASSPDGELHPVGIHATSVVFTDFGASGTRLRVLPLAND